MSEGTTLFSLSGRTRSMISPKSSSSGNRKKKARTAVGRAQDPSIAEHYFQTAAHAEVVKVRRVTGAFVQGVADNAAVGRSRSGIEHELVAVPSQFVIHLLIGHSGFDLGKAQRFVDLQDAIHTRTDIHDETARPDRALEAKATILASTNAVERDAILIGEAHDRLHVRGRGWINNTSWKPVSTRQQVATVTRDGFCRGIDGGVTEGVAESVEESRRYVRTQ